MKSHRFDKDILESDIKIHNLKDKIKEHTWNYHNDLLQLLEYKTRGDGQEGRETERLYNKVCEDFGSIVSIQSLTIKESWDLAKMTLERAFELSGIDKKYFDNDDTESDDE